MNGNNAKQKVYVGLSGGVDSAVSAALLKQQGYNVIGVYIKVWQPDWIECTWKEERRDAMRVAAHLGIPFVTLDLVNEYKHGVIDYMISEYSAGRTPNPDVMCNREVKFGAFWKWSKGNGADFVATGHYAQVVSNKAIATEISADSNNERKKFSMLAGVDKNKDQSYFLWTLNQNDLEHIIFPIGHLTKPEVRRLAKKFKLPNANKRDSQGLCFIGKVDIKEFLRHYIKKEVLGLGKGDVLNAKGEVIGKHSGALFFTLGERHGFTITEKGTSDEPFYVIAKDMAQNTITVSARTASADVSGNSDLVKIENVNWTGQMPQNGRKVMVRTRYRQPLAGATIKLISSGKSCTTLGSAELTLDNTTDPITPGQSLVIYIGEECLGGGIIL
jgi:tRNA-specific 2-thiouridylase